MPALYLQFQILPPITETHYPLFSFFSFSFELSIILYNTTMIPI